MSGCGCSNGSAAPVVPPARLITTGPAGGLICGVLWLVCPKCPACVAGYLAVFGGTLSIPAMVWVLTGLRGALFGALAVGVSVLLWRFGRLLVR